MAAQSKIATISSTALRLGSYLYFRWVPGPAVAAPTLLTLFALYLPAAAIAYLQDTTHETIKKVAEVETIDVVERDLGDTETNDTSTNESYADVVKGSAKKRRKKKKAARESAAHETVITDTIDIQEEIIAKPRKSRPFTTLLTGTPRKRNWIMSILTVLLNIVIALGIIDYTFTPHNFYPSHDLSFVRLGHISPNEARFLIREPDQSKMPISLELRIKDPIALDNSHWTVAGGARWTSNETDFTASLAVPLPKTQQHIYEWRTSNNHSGEFTTPPKPGAVNKYNNGRFTFLSTSCIIPRFPYSPLEHPLAIPGMRSLAKVIPSLNAQFMLFLGDFIYIDVPYIFGKTREHYRRKYRQVYASPEWPAVGQNLSWIHTLDDHEISNNWSANTTGEYEAAMHAWDAYQAGTNPPVAKIAGSNKDRADATYFEFSQGPVSVFMLDTRTYRSDNLALNATDAEKTMLGSQQLQDLLYWINRPEPKGISWKVIASSVPFTQNWPVDCVDTWGGFLHERSIILEAIWDAYLQGMGTIILSGDRHEFAVTKFPPPADGKWPPTAAPYEFSVSPLNQFSSPVPTYKQASETDEMVAYVHLGLSKFGVIDIDPFGEQGRSLLKYRMFLDGEESWNITLASPVRSAEVEGNFKGLWGRIWG